ncbi:hypothetical protein [Halobellus limi]|uniref:Uncharacterized protein n=2 Tax=Halobellus limi TaxID=699433 RepID=A0A4D6H1G6_9EURY|nr:hypothetical protein [Halobellus limi]QCC47663.1 hypothetical protein DV707_08325 [Halobellus limi]
MTDTLSPPNRADVEGVLQNSSAVEEIISYGDNWIYVTGDSRSLLLCLGAEALAHSGGLTEGSELLDPDDSGVVFATAPMVHVLGISDYHCGGAERLSSDSTEAFIEDLGEMVSKLLVDGFDDYPELTTDELPLFFSNIISDEGYHEGTPIKGSGRTLRGLPVAWPPDVEEGMVDLLANWLLFDNPKDIVDLCSDGWSLTHRLLDYCHREGDVALRLVDLPSEGTRVGRLVSAYRFPGQRRTEAVECNLNDILKEPAEQTDLDQFEGNPDTEDTAASAVVAGFCSGRPLDVNESLKERASALNLGLSPRLSLPTYLTAEGIQSLDEGGRGVFVLPFRQLARQSFLQYIFDQGQLHSVLLLDDPEEPGEGARRSVEIAIVLFEKDRSDNDSKAVRLVEMEAPEFDPRLNRLVQAPIQQLDSSDAADITGVSFHLVNSADLRELNPRLVLREPQIVPFLRAEETRELGDIVDKIQYGVKSGANDFFYLNSEEVDQLDLPSKFLTPVLRGPRDPVDEEGQIVTAGSTDFYALDLREFLQQFDENPPEETVLRELRRQGFRSVADYIESHKELSERASLQMRDYWFCPFDSSIDNPPDLLIGRFSDGTWYRYRGDGAIIDQSWYGVWCGDTDPDSLIRLLSSEPYELLIQHLGQPMSQVHSQYTIRDISQLPINTDSLDAGLDEITFPPERRRDQRQLDQAVVNGCSEQTVREALATLIEPDDQFAWAWFLSPEEYEEFQRQYEIGEEAAREYVAERLSEREIRKMLTEIEESPLRMERWETMAELAEEYREGHYRLFMYGATPQFEGFIMDWAENKEYPIFKRDGRPYVQIPGDTTEEEDQEIPKSLGALIEAFIPRGFGDFLQDDITTLRNTITHGEIIEMSHERAAICFLALHTLALQIREDRLGTEDYTP